MTPQGAWMAAQSSGGAWVRVCATSGLLCALALGAAGQQDQGVIIGTVTDASTAVIPGATITALNPATNASIRTQTNANGVYLLGPLKVGVYSVSAAVDGFTKFIRHGVQIHANDRLGLDFVLDPSAMVEIIQVWDDTPLLNTETAALEHVVERRHIDQLPLVDRNYQVLAKLAAGVLPEIGGRDRGPLQRGGALSSGFTSHGQPALQNNYLIDGVDNNTTIMGFQDRKAQVVVPSLEAVQEFKLQTSNYSAEFGRNAGAVVNVSIRSGTNDLHGGVYEYLRNEAFDARPAFGYNDRDGDGKADPEALRQHMFGGTLGGPVVRDRTFYFGSWERWRVNHDQTDRGVVPTTAERNGDFSQTPGLTALRDPLGTVFPGNRIPESRFDPVMAKLMALYPAPNFHDPGTRQNYISNPPWRVSRDQFDARLDHRFNERDHLFGRFSWYGYESLREGPLPGLARGGGNNDRSLDDNGGYHLTVSETSIFGPGILHEIRFGHKRLRNHRRNSSDVPLAEANSRFGVRGVPVPSETPIYGLTRFVFNGKLAYAGLGGGLFQPNEKVASSVQFLDNWTLLRGAHSLKVGADLRWDSSDIFGSHWTRGEHQFNGRFTGVSLGDALLGWTNQSRLSNLVVGEMRFSSWMFYLQDDWKVTRGLTLNLGLRYELQTPWRERNNRLNYTVLDPADPSFGHIIRAGGPGAESRALLRLDANNFAPRIGLAWQPGSRWSVRAGAGIFHGGPIAIGASARTVQNYPFTSSVVRHGTNREPALVLRDGFPSAFLGAPGLTVDHVEDLPDDSVYRTWDRRYPLTQVCQWNFSVQRQVGDGLALTASYVGSASQNVPYSYNYNAAGIGDPNTEKQRRLFPGLSSLDLHTPLAHSSYHGLDIGVQKRFGAGFGLTAAYTWGHNIGQTPDAFVAGDNGSPQDIRCFSCEKGNSSSDVRHRMVAAYIWELPVGEGKALLNRGGAWNTAFGGWRITGWFSAQTGMYFSPLLSDPGSHLGTGGVGIWRPDVIGDWRVENPGPDGWYAPEAFVRPCAADGSSCRFGSLGRNTLQEPGIWEWTAALAKQFVLSDRLRLEFRWEALNAANHPNYATPERSLDSPDAGKIRSTHGQPRQMQFGLRLSF